MAGNCSLSYLTSFSRAAHCSGVLLAKAKKKRPGGAALVGDTSRPSLVSVCVSVRETQVSKRNVVEGEKVLLVS